MEMVKIELIMMMLKYQDDGDFDDTDCNDNDDEYNSTDYDCQDYHDLGMTIKTVVMMILMNKKRDNEDIK